MTFWSLYHLQTTLKLNPYLKTVTIRSIYPKMMMSKTYIQNKYVLTYTLVLLDITKSYSRLYVESHSLNCHLASQKYTNYKTILSTIKKKKSSNPILSRQQSQKVTSCWLLSD